MARGPTVKTGGGAKTGTHSATTGYEAELWRMADARRKTVAERPSAERTGGSPIRSIRTALLASGDT